MLIDGLPPESLTKTALRDELDPAELARYVEERADRSGYGPWSRGDYLSAAIIDRLGEVVRAIAQSVGGRPPAVDPYPRPGVAPRNAPLSPVARDFMERRRAQINADIERDRQAAGEVPPDPQGA